MPPQWALGLLCGVLVVLFAVPDGSAQVDHSTVYRVLRESTDFRMRVRAALALGNSADRSVTPQLMAALSDDDPNVRAAAATALGTLGDPAAVAALRRAMSDEAQIVRSEASRAIQRIQTAGVPTAPTAPPQTLTASNGAFYPTVAVMPEARDINWQNIRYVVVLGPMQNRSTFRQVDLDSLFQREVMRNLIVLRGVAVLGEHNVSSNADREIRRRRLPKLRMEGSLTRISSSAIEPRQLAVRCEVSLMLMDEPSRNIRGMLTGAATGSDTRHGHREQQERALAQQAVAGAVRSALSGAAQAIATAGRR
jgi:hypothetical protein